MASELVLRHQIARFGQLSGLRRCPFNAGRHRRMVFAGGPRQVAVEEAEKMLGLDRNAYVVAALAVHPYHLAVVPEYR